MKVKIIKCDTCAKLEYEINRFISNKSTQDIIDIKYSSYGFYGQTYSAMIIMR